MSYPCFISEVRSTAAGASELAKGFRIEVRVGIQVDAVQPRGEVEFKFECAMVLN